MRWRLLAAIVLIQAAGLRQAMSADKLTVILDWFVNANHESLFAAQYCGDYARANLDVTFVAPADPSSPPRLVAAGEADLAVSYQTELPFLAQAHLPIVRVGTLIDQPMEVLMTLPFSGITSLAQLKGRRIGVSVGPGEEATLDAMLASVGLKPGEVTRVQVNFQIEQALMTHSVAAVMGGMRNYELIDLEQRGLSPRAFSPEQHGVPPYDELILVARPGEAQAPKIRRFLAALRDGTACLLKKPDFVWRAFVAAHPDLDTRLNRAAWFSTLPALARDPAALDLPRNVAFQKFLVAEGVLTHPAPVRSYTR